MFSKAEKSRIEKKYTNGTVMPSSITKDDVPSIIAADLRIVGNLICTGAIEIEGEIEGNLSCGRVTVRRTGAIKGDVIADEIHVDGEIEGLVKGKSITLTESGRIVGMVVYESLAVKDGAYIEGQCQSVERAQRTMEALEAKQGTPGNFDNNSVENEKEHSQLVEG
jgi:cytoskeletal protein CcmA (bactofilin family)